MQAYVFHLKSGLGGRDQFELECVVLPVSTGNDKHPALNIQDVSGNQLGEEQGNSRLRNRKLFATKWVVG